jgi:hypothetical protein
VLQVLACLLPEQAREKNKLDLYRAIHEEKPGERIRIIERLMHDDPSLSYADALEKYTYLNGGATKETLAEIKADQAKTAAMKVYQEGLKAINSSVIGIMGNRPNASPADRKNYLDAVAKLGLNPMGEVAAPTTPASVIPGAKIVGTR